MWAGTEGICQARLVNTVCAPPSSFIFPCFLTQQVPIYGNWTVIFPVYDVYVDKIREDGMHTQFWLKYWREKITWKTKGGCDDNIRMNLRPVKCKALSFVNANKYWVMIFSDFCDQMNRCYLCEETLWHEIDVGKYWYTTC
jgi:hypothetical protein